MKGRDWFFRGTTIGTGIGLLGVFLTILPIDSLGDWTTGDSLAFGLLSTTVGILWEVNSRQQRQAAAQDRTSRLMKALEGSDLDENPLVILCESAGQITKKSLPDHIKKQIDAEIDRFSKRLDDLAGSHVLAVDGEANLMRFVRACTSVVERNLWATSAADGVDERFWSGAEGKAYLEVQDRAKARGVEIRRIFFTSQKDFTPAVRRWMEDQEGRGILVAARTEVEMDDFIVFDKTAVALTGLKPGGHAVEGGRLSFAPADIAARIEEFELWWESARREWEAIKAAAGASKDDQT